MQSFQDQGLHTLLSSKLCAAGRPYIPAGCRDCLGTSPGHAHPSGTSLLTQQTDPVGQHRKYSSMAVTTHQQHRSSRLTL